MNLIEKHNRKLKKLCDEHSVSKLYVFGSIVNKSFSKDSDIDFIVTFKPIQLNNYADNYFDFKFSLEDLFKRNIDLLEAKALKNPFLKRSIDRTKELVYG